MTSEATPQQPTQEPVYVESESLWRATLRRLFRQRSAMVGGVILTMLLTMVIFPSLIAPYDPEQVLIGKEDVKKRDGPCIHLLVDFLEDCTLEKPQHIFGLDGNVRDVFSRIVHGARISIGIGVAIVTVSIVSGTFLGAVAAYVGGWLDNAIMRVMDVILAFPALLLAMAIVFIFERGLFYAMIALGIVYIPAYARVVRSTVISLKEQDFVEASRAMGATDYQLLFKRILPNSLAPIIVQGTLGIGTAILDMAALSFIGLGAQPPQPEWGTMLGSERNQIFSAPHLVFIPGIFIMLTVLSFNLLGDGLRDALDPRLARAGK